MLREFNIETLGEFSYFFSDFDLVFVEDSELNPLDPEKRHRGVIFVPVHRFQCPILLNLRKCYLKFKYVMSVTRIFSPMHASFWRVRPKSTSIFQYSTPQFYCALLSSESKIFIKKLRSLLSQRIYSTLVGLILSKLIR